MLNGSPVLRGRYILLAATCVLLIAPRILMALGDPAYRTFFVEEKSSGYSARNASLDRGWDSGGGRYQSAAYLPGATVLTSASFELFGRGVPQLRLPFVAAAVLCLIFLGLALYGLCGEKLGLLLLAGFGASPLLMTLNGTSLNENLLLPVEAFVIYLFSAFEERRSEGNSRSLLFMIGLSSFCSIFVKVDGIVVMAASATVILLSDKAGGAGRITSLAYFGLGAVAGACLYLVYILTVPGIDNTIDIYRFFNEIWSMKYGNGLSLSDLAHRLFVVIPANLYTFLPGLLLFGIMGLISFTADWRRQPLSARFSIVLIAMATVVMARSPLLYWKRFVVAIVPLFWIAASYIRYSADPARPFRNRMLLFFSAFAAVAIYVHSLYYQFDGHWRVLNPLFPLTTLGIVVASAAAAFLLAISPAGWKLTYRAGILFCIGAVVNGMVFLYGYNWRNDSDRIGMAMASVIGGGSVVAEEHAYRFFAYYSDAPVRFMHENDPAYPGGIIELAARTSPEFVAVTDAYGKLPRQVEEKLPGYVMVSDYEYYQPETLFMKKNKTQTIYLYRLEHR